MKMLGIVKDVQFLRGGVTVTIDPNKEAKDDAVDGDDFSFKEQPRGSIIIGGLTKDVGALYRTGEQVEISIFPAAVVDEPEVASPSPETPPTPQAAFVNQRD